MSFQLKFNFFITKKLKQVRKNDNKAKAILHQGNVGDPARLQHAVGHRGL